MSSIRGMIERALACQNKLEFCDHDLKIAFYSIVTVLTIACIAALLTMSYAGSGNPLDLISYNNFTFSYSGDPIYTNVWSDDCYVGLNGVKDSVTDISLPGESKLALYPTGNITATAYNNTKWQISGPVEKNITLMPGEGGKVSIVVALDDDFNYNMRMHYNYSKDRYRLNNATDVLNITRKGDGQYIVSTSYHPGVSKWFEIKNEPYWNLSVNVTRNRTIGSGWGAGMDDVKLLTYSGRISVDTDDEFLLRAPVKAMSAAKSKQLKLKHAEGSLNIEHIEHKSNPADDIEIEPVNTLNVSILNGHVVAYGYAKELDFRKQEFGHPWSVIIKQGHFALLTGLLSSFLTIMLARLVKTIRKK